MLYKSSEHHVGGNMKKVIIVSLILLLLFSLNVFAVGLITLDPIQSEGTSLSVDRGSTIIYSEVGSEFVAISSGEIENSGLATLLISVTNNSDSPIYFRDSQIEIFGKNGDSDSWKLMSVWSADEYYKETARRIESEKFWTAFSGALNVASASLGSYSNSSVYSSSGNYYITTRTYNPADVAIASMVADLNNRQVASLGKMELDSLKKNLLFSSEIKPNETYMGLIGIDIPRYGLTDFRIQYTSQDGTQREYLFSRSDKTDATSIFADQKYHDKQSVDFVVDIANRYFYLFYTYNSPSSVGAYLGFGIGNGNTQGLTPYYRYKWDASGSYNYNEVEKIRPGFGFDMPFGITFKCLPYTWGMFGMSLRYGDAISKYKHETNHDVIYAGDSLTFSVEIQGGCNVIYGPLSLITMIGYDFRYRQVNVKFGVGYGF